MDLQRSRQLQARLQSIVPGGSHTYAKGADQFPEHIPGIIAKGQGCHVWDVDGNEFIEYGMGLRAVTLGHAHPQLVEAVRESLSGGVNFTRPAAIELECAEALLELIRPAEMVKFTKDGSTANTAALRLARRYTGRELVAVCADQPFISYDDWFMCTTTMDGGMPARVQEQTLRFEYNNADSLQSLFEAYPRRIAAVCMEAARSVEPTDSFLKAVRALCNKHGAVFILDEMITGFRWDIGGAQKVYDIEPDLSTFGKALANGFALSALCGKRELMRLGSRERAQDDVFLLSTTHGADTTALAAALCTMKIYRSEAVIEHLYRQGERLAQGVRQAAELRGVSKQFDVVGRPCNLLFGTRDPQGNPSQAFRTLLLQETLRRGVLMPSLVVSHAHQNEDIDRTIEAISSALGIYARALDEGVEKYLEGRPTRPVFGRR